MRKLKVNDMVVLAGTLGPVGRITKLRTSAATPSAMVYWGFQDRQERVSKIPLSGLELLVYPPSDVTTSAITATWATDENIAVTPLP